MKVVKWSRSQRIVGKIISCETLQKRRDCCVCLKIWLVCLVSCVGDLILSWGWSGAAHAWGERETQEECWDSQFCSYTARMPVASWGLLLSCREWPTKGRTTPTFSPTQKERQTHPRTETEGVPGIFYSLWRRYLYCRCGCLVGLWKTLDTSCPNRYSFLFPIGTTVSRLRGGQRLSSISPHWESCGVPCVLHSSKFTFLHFGS